LLSWLSGKPAFCFMENYQDQTLSVRDAGAKGGLATLAKHGSDHFRVIGKKGQARLADTVTSEQRRAWGAKGGRPRKLKLQDVGEKGQLR
jgi:hypothetical protein